MTEKQNVQMTQLITKALSDPTFKETLIENPVATLQSEGIEVPDGVEINVVENTDQLFHLVLPVPPGELSDDELDNVAGGLTTYSTQVELPQVRLAGYM